MGSQHAGLKRVLVLGTVPGLLTGGPGGEGDLLVTGEELGLVGEGCKQRTGQAGQAGWNCWLMLKGTGCHRHRGGDKRSPVCEVTQECSLKPCVAFIDAQCLPRTAIHCKARPL